MLDVAYQALQQAIHDKTTSDRIGDIIGMGIGIVGAYQQFKQGLPVCEEVASYKYNWAQVSEPMTIIGDPLKNMELMTQNLSAYEGNLDEDIKSAQFHYMNEDYEKVGEFFGNIINQAAYGNKMAMLGMNGHGQQAMLGADGHDLFLY